MLTELLDSGAASFHPSGGKKKAMLQLNSIYINEAFQCQINVINIYRSKDMAWLTKRCHCLNPLYPGDIWVAMG